MQRRILFLLSLFFLLSQPFLTHAATYYAQSGGTNNSCGAATNPNTPRSSMGNGISCLGGGDTLILKCGTYHEGINDGQIPNGSPAAYTIIKAETPRCAILNDRAGISFGFSGTNQHYIEINGLVLDGTGLGTQIVAIEISADSGTGNLNIFNNAIQNYQGNQGAGTGTNAFGIMYIADHHTNTGVIFRGNLFRDIGLGDQPNQDAGWSYGIYYAGGGAIFENNEMYRISGYGIHGYTGHGGVSFNIIRNNYFEDTGGPAILQGNSFNQIYNNIIVRAGVGPAYQREGAIAVGMWSGDAESNMIYNNTIYDSRTDRCINNGGSNGGVARNNICYNNSNNQITSDAGGFTQDHNLQGTNPLFVNAAAADFHLQAGSPAINAGLIADDICTKGTPTRDGTNRCQGSSIDMGALEGQGTVIQQLPPPLNLRLGSTP